MADVAAIAAADARKLAIVRGEKFYSTGRPCRRQHLTLRFTNSGKCITCLRKRDRETRKEQRCSAEYKAKKELQKQTRIKARQTFLLEKYGILFDMSDNGKIYRIINAEKAKLKTREWRYADPERAKKSRNESRARHPEKARESARRRKLLKKSIEGSHTLDDRAEIMRLQKGKCAICKVKFNDNKKPTIDHIIPISKGGTDYKKNIQLACGPCNSAKGNIHPIDFSQKLGWLV